MFHRRSLRNARIEPLPNSPDRTDSNSASDDEQPLSLSAVRLPRPAPPLPALPPAPAVAADAVGVAVLADAAADAAADAPIRRRGRYSIMSDERRAMALDLMLNQRMSVAQVARTLGNGIKATSLYSLRRSFTKTSRVERLKKGGTTAKYTSEDAAEVCAIQDEHSQWTYTQLRDEWRTRTGKTGRLSDGTINRMLRGGRFSTKQITLVPEARNTAANITARRTYALRASQWMDGEVLYIDEAGFNLHLVRRRGRSRIGQRATVTTVNSRGGNISICAAISPTLGVMHYKIRLGAFNSDEYVAFLRELVQEKLVLQTRSFHIVMDNVAFHKTEAVKAVFTERTPIHIQEFLPTYSPQLNAIEECWSKVKAHVRQQEKRTRDTLIELMNQGIFNVSTDDCEGWHRHVTRHLVNCVDRQPLE